MYWVFVPLSSQIPIVKKMIYKMEKHNNIPFFNKDFWNRRIHMQTNQEANNSLFCQASSSIQAFVECMIACKTCAAACLQEEHMMRECIKHCLTCVEICQLCTSLELRHSELAEQAMPLCAHACQLCAAECGKHEHEHCQICAKACLACAQACQAYRA